MVIPLPSIEGNKQISLHKIEKISFWRWSHLRWIFRKITSRWGERGYSNKGEGLLGKGECSEHRSASGLRVRQEEFFFYREEQTHRKNRVWGSEMNGSSMIGQQIGDSEASPSPGGAVKERLCACSSWRWARVRDPGEGQKLNQSSVNKHSVSNHQWGQKLSKSFVRQRKGIWEGSMYGLCKQEGHSWVIAKSHKKGWFSAVYAVSSNTKRRAL